MSMKPEKTVLRVDASGRHAGSQTRVLADKLLEKLQTAGVTRVVTRDLAHGVEFVDEAWINANFTPEEDRTEAQKLRLLGSDALVDEVMQSDVIVIATPIYNFGVPAALKAWIDQVARARKTFRYTDTGPVGLLNGKKAYLVMTSGGTEVGSDWDFASSYLRHILGFIGIHDVTIFAADQLVQHGEGRLASVANQIDRHVASDKADAA